MISSGVWGATERSIHHAPSQHLAKMGQIHRMSDAGANAVRYKALIVIAAVNFWQAAQLFRAEALAGLRVKVESGSKQECSRNPRPSHRIKRNIPPRPRH